MKKYLPTYFKGLLLAASLLFLNLTTYASHIVGAELRYTYVANSCNTYTISVYLYGDCGPASSVAFATLPTSAPFICIYDGPTLVGNVSLPIQAPAAGAEVTPVCPDSLAFTQCTVSTSSLPGIKKFVYQANYTFPYRSAHWRLVYTGGNGGGSAAGRAAAITNLTGGSIMQLIDTLNNSFTNTRGHNSSPFLTVEPIPFFCHDSLLTSCYNPGAVDINDVNPANEPSGDSLTFSLIPATNGNGSNTCGAPGAAWTYTGIEYPLGPPVNGAFPLTVHDATPASFNFDANTGQLCFIPLSTQRSVVVYNVDEYRDDTLGKMTSIAGTGVAGSAGDGLPAISAELNRPAGICRDAAGNIYIADMMNNKIRKIDLAGNISTIAGTGAVGYSGDGGTAITATLNHPIGIALDGTATGDLFIADFGNNVIRKINLAGVISTVAGNGTAGFGGDGGLATAPACMLNGPVAVFSDPVGNLYVSDTVNERIRRITPAGIISTIAGTGVAGYVSDGVPAVTAPINQPYGLYVDAVPNIYFADCGNNRIRKINVGGIISTIAGTGTAGFAGDGGLANVAQLNHPTGVFVDNQGYVIIADHLNNRIRMIDSCSYINTIDGNGVPGFAGDGGLPASAELDSMLFVIKDIKENIYISDFKNNRIRYVVRNANINHVQVGSMQREMTFLVKDCTYTEPTGKIDTGFGGGITKIDSTHYYGCANSGTFILRTNPTEADTSLHITVTAVGLTSGFTFGVDSNNTNHPHDSITGNTSLIAPGNYTFYLTYTDNHCPLVGTNTIAFSVQILPVPTIRDSLITAATCTTPAKFLIIPGGTGKPWTIKVSQTFPTNDTIQIFTSDTSTIVDSLPPGTYNITIFTNVSTDCAQNVTMTLDTAHFTITGVPTNPTYCGANNGYIVIHGLTPGNVDSVRFVYNGVHQATQGFLVSPSGTDTIKNLLAGVYDSIRVQENLCFTNFLPAITLVNPPFTLRTVTTKNPSKCGFCDGVDTVWGLHPGQLDTIQYVFTPPGGTSSTFTISHSIGADSMVILSGLCGGSYTNFIVNTAGVCNATLPGPYTLTAPGIAAAFDTAVHYGCHGDTIFFNNQSTPAADLTYQWFFGDGGSSTLVNPIHNYVNTTGSNVTIKLYITNTKCVDSAVMTKSFSNYIHAGFTFNPDPFVCQDSLVTFTNTSTGTNPTYTWMFGDGGTSNAINPTHNYVNTGKYSITLVANENIIPVPSFYTPCFDTMVQQISVDSNSAVSILGTDSVICQGEAITFRGIYSTLGDTMVTWSFGDGSTVYNANPILHSYEDSSSFVVSLNVNYRACPSNSAKFNVHVFGYPSIYLGPDLTMCPGGVPLKLIDDRNQNNPYAKWQWNTGEITPGIYVTKPGTYVNVVNINGCTASDTVYVQKDCYMDIPNVFSPNGDGTNDYFYPRQVLTKGLVSFKMDIYNRWGQMVYETTATDGRGWDGKFNDQPQPEGVYIYVIDATFKDGEIEHQQGNITLLR